MGAFVDRDGARRIVGRFATAQRDGQEYLAADAPELVLDDTVRAKLAQIAAQLAQHTTAGVEFGGKRFAIDDRSVGRIVSRAVFARACIDGADQWNDEVSGWIAIDNTRPSFTAAEFWEFAKAAQLHVTALTLNARSLKDAVLAAAAAGDLEALAAIDPSTGWE